MMNMGNTTLKSPSNESKDRQTDTDDCDQSMTDMEVDSTENTKEGCSNESTAAKKDTNNCDNTFCEPCQHRSITIHAIKYCEQCDERYCDNCAVNHTVQKLTRSHTLTVCSSKLKESACVRCEPCLQKGVDSSVAFKCEECKYGMCTDCKDSHLSNPETSKHTISMIKEVYDCKPCFAKGVITTAATFCLDCDYPVALCVPCGELHATTETFRNHKMSSDLSNLMSSMLKKQFPQPGTAQPMKRSHEQTQCESNYEDCTSNAKKRITDNIRTDCPMSEERNSKKLRTISGKRNEAKEVTDHMVDVSKRPGRPYTVDTIRSNSLLLQWDGVKLGENDAYQIMFKNVNGKWRVFKNTALKPKIEIDGLQSNTAYIFRVRVVNDETGTEEQFSQESEALSTTESPAAAMVKGSKLVYDGEIPVYALPLTEEKKARNKTAKTRKLYLGPKDLNPRAKNVMIVGATGSGKSTLVNAMANYIMGVTWEDPFRFTLVDVETDEQQMAGDEARSQTQWITCYTINRTVSSRLPFTINLIDTPGFGDTRGIEHDQRIVKQIKDLFDSKGVKGVATIDAICFILKAPDARLTPTQSYIFESILALFGKDIKDNICTLVTFADGQRPPVLASLEAMEHQTLPYKNYFTFNNSALYVGNSGTVGVNAPFFWDMGMRSCKEFFDHIINLPTKSLLLTSEVLRQRERLENTIEHLYQEVNNGLSKIGVLEQEMAIFTKYRRQIRENRDFTYYVTENVQEIIELSGNKQYTTNCLTCNFTCHESCAYSNDDDKAKCVAMRNGNCIECPGRCHWKQHKNTPYIIKLIPKKVTKRYSEKQKIYEDATQKSLSQEQILSAMCKDIETLECAISDRLNYIADCNNRLKEIALRPDPLTVVQYLELIIDSERLEKKPGFQNRINVLEKCKKKAQYGKTVQVFSDRLQGTRQSIHDTMNQPGEEPSTSGGILEGFRHLGTRLINSIRV